MKLFDSHCHLYDEQYNEIKDEVIQKIRDSKLELLVDIGTDIPTSELVVADTKAYDFCYGAVGIYPEYTEGLTDKDLVTILQMYKQNEKIVAIGEIGLDYHDFEHYPSKEIQREGFIRQIRMAVENDIPICIHSRDADQESFDILKKEALGKIPVLLHCFSGSAELAKEYVKYGACISLGGPVTYKNSRHSKEVAAVVPNDRLLIETDAPYLAPVPLRGKLNLPCYVEYTCCTIAEIRGVTPEELAATTFENACRFYRIKERSLV